MDNMWHMYTRLNFCFPANLAYLRQIVTKNIYITIKIIVNIVKIRTHK